MADNKMNGVECTLELENGMSITYEGKCNDKLKSHCHIAAKVGACLLVAVLMTGGTTLRLFGVMELTRQHPVDYTTHPKSDNSVTPVFTNITCPFHYNLTDNTAVNICLYNGEVLLDIRQYNPTIKSVGMNNRTYTTLGLFWDNIRQDIEKLQHDGY